MLHRRGRRGDDELHTSGGRNQDVILGDDYALMLAVLRSRWHAVEAYDLKRLLHAVIFQLEVEDRICRRIDNTPEFLLAHMHLDDRRLIDRIDHGNVIK